MGAEKEAVRRRYLRAHAGQFALVMFSRNSCGYCRVQWPILERFREETGWQVTQMDLERRPELGQRFGVAVTPTTMVIRRARWARMRADGRRVGKEYVRRCRARWGRIDKKKKKKEKK